MAKILIFMSKTGGGHVSLAESLRDRLQADYQVELIDPQPGIIHWHYRTLSRYALWLWAVEFKLSDTPRRSLAAHKAFNALFARNVGEVLQRFKPDLVMSTYPFLTYEVTQAIGRTGQHIPFAMLFADPNRVHMSWLTESNAEAAFAPTRETYNQDSAAGFAPERLHLTGWPVRVQFYQQPATVQQEVCQRLQLEPEHFTVFLQGGGEGAAKFVQTVENVLAVDNIQVILATGTNQEIYNRYQGMAHLRSVPFTKEIAPYMAAADVVMGKAGPNMLFESVTLGRPFIATTYIPGQEEVNLEFITRHHLGWVALNAQDQRNLVASLTKEQAKITEMTATVEAYRQWNTAATEKILPLARSLIGNVPVVPYE